MSLSADLQAALDELDVQVHNCEAVAAQVSEAVTILREMVPRIATMERASKTMERALNTLLDRSTPKSSCVFCPVDENRDNHFSGRCSRFADTVARTAQASRLRLCLCCLMPEHMDDCRVKCGNCGLDHNVLLCTRKKPSHPMKRSHH
ncbi:unnamed protein product [Heligmosomoides polygyrus]|uniref:Uncharacterized protein n=1 Tax=Heligmosomoides polygyrus TaxID=6339 RepID=A0A183GNH7_HELPZ|nr:unnamed protein product [Heligmosomoides polygyrus]